ncbi:hypothetical protein EJ05DRAFT_514214 [Pseudovirgaria hyperparasitica]|uniref:Uncharacterized protein n=1 Tax=Pseudovirgaria hyperparasitica TaxID=470096 RepID=A0A6A6VUF0_9PEZI|nr:uncharacterized protein EJ05DRAFT_514214 [Pseudovirgaria hyperparasitica]KAF2754202.1 hypothetical protein EJ05DRAFT_514214 [Pseudovirgaria hyperparasitica]
MASRRILSTEKGVLDVDQNGNAASTPSNEKSDISPAVPASVIYKLLAATLAMVILPLGTYFATVNTIFKGNATFAGATAAVMANVVLIGYIIAAVKEDESERVDADKKSKKSE